MADHAPLSPSAAHRWMACPASVQASQSVSSVSSVYAAEGTLAHSQAEWAAAVRFGLPHTPEQPDGVDDEMIRCAGEYADLLASMSTPATSQHLEHLSDPGVPKCWGTADAVLVTPPLLDVVDFKYGMGVRVDADDNPQLMLYGVGALDSYDLLGEITHVRLTIHQPRLEHTSQVTMTAAELRMWRDQVAIPAALAALTPGADFHPSESACRFCPIAGECAARAKHVLTQDFGNPDLMTNDDLADALRRTPELKAWLADVEAVSLERANHRGEKLPGFKVVLSGGRRKITDQLAAINKLVAAGYTREQVSRLDAKTLGELEALVGKSKLPELLGDLLVKSPGREALVPESDPREEINSAGLDFSKQ